MRPWRNPGTGDEEREQARRWCYVALVTGLVLGLVAAACAVSGCCSMPSWPSLPPGPGELPTPDRTRWHLAGDRATVSLPLEDLHDICYALHEWVTYARALEAIGHWAEDLEEEDVSVSVNNDGLDLASDNDIWWSSTTSAYDVSIASVGSGFDVIGDGDGQGGLQLEEEEEER